MEYFCWFNAYRKKTENLSDQEVGRLIRALSTYNETGEIVELKGREGIAFDFIKADIDAATERYNKKCDTNRKNRTSTTDNDRQRPITTVTKTKNKNQKQNDAKASIEPSNDGMCFAPVIDAWNTLPDPIPKIDRINQGSTREAMLKVRIRDYSLDSVLQAIDNIRQSTFCQGVNNNGWIISFDWFVKPNNFQKVLEGNYNDRKQKKTDNDRVRDELAEWMEEVVI